MCFVVNGQLPPPTTHLKFKRSAIAEDFDMVYIINLKRRPERKRFMTQVMWDLKIDNYKFIEAFDGK